MSATEPGTPTAPAREGDLPLRGGRQALSWPGTLLACLSLGMFQVTLLFAYGYLALQQGGWPPEGIDAPAWGQPAVATLVLLASLAPAVLLHRAARRRLGGRVQAGAAGIVVLGVAFLAVQGATYADLPAGPAEHAYGSAFLVSALAHHALAVGGVLACVLVLLQVWGDVPAARLRSTAVGLSLYWYFVVAAWLLVAAVLYVSPALFGRVP